MERRWSSSQDKKGKDQVARVVRKPTTELPAMIRLWQAGPTRTNQGDWLQPSQCLGAWNVSLRPLFSSSTYQEVMDVMVHTMDGAVAIIYTSKWKGDSKDGFGTNPRSKSSRPVVKKTWQAKLRESLVRPTKGLVGDGPRWHSSCQRSCVARTLW